MVYSIPAKRNEHAQSTWRVIDLPKSAYGRAPFKALRFSGGVEIVPPERLPRRAARGLGARSSHQFAAAFMINPNSWALTRPVWILHRSMAR
jgi:hypothetical protein